MQRICEACAVATKNDLERWILEVLTARGGTAHHVRVAEAIWDEHRTDLEASGDLLFTWQYDLRWAAQRLRDSGRLEEVQGRGDGIWRLKPLSDS
jgi:hypothetical protein